MPNMEPIIVSYSELDTYRQCPLKHNFAYVERWRKPQEDGSALSKGSLWHLVLEAHYLELVQIWEQGLINVNTDPWEPVLIERVKNAATPQLIDPDTGGWVSEDAELIAWMYDGHLEKYGVEPEWTPLAVEFAFQIPLKDERGRNSRYQMKGKIDLIMRSNLSGLIWILDHKSGANLPSQMDLEIDDQFGIYTWAMRQLGYEVVGSIHSAARTKRNLADYPGYTGKARPQTLDDRFRRTLLNRSEEETAAVALDAYNTARNAYPPRSKQLPLYSSPDPRQCGWKCDFKEVHLMGRQGIDYRESLQTSGFVQDFTRHN